MKYDTTEKRMKFLKKKGNIITFKKPFYPHGTLNESRSQIIVNRLQKTKAGSVKIIGNYYDTNWYNSIDALLESIDWQWMEAVHGD
ncbi:hypothetical protein [Elizabethkingia anophelis]|uniref:hypothetical protein n=1 Tax=Elizabethkingia anophelis TaxID=1117645 RepID=UPI00136C7C11|nr:hypothetical protein [Elizabethkingia anophelis]MYY43985.1 hypothetical protein [Elizabethkingia anophelis]